MAELHEGFYTPYEKPRCLKTNLLFCDELACKINFNCITVKLD